MKDGMRVGIEVGGTFTDLIEIHDGIAQIAKVPSTPSQPDVGAIDAIEAAGIDIKNISDLVHGSTVATNAVLERKGGRVCVIVTKGLRDIFNIQRHDRTSIYDLKYQKPRPIVDRQHVWEVNERIDTEGIVIQSLDDAELVELAKKFLACEEYDAIAICLLNSFVNANHERQIAQTIKQFLPDMPITCSCDVSREFREYERASTTALAAYVQPNIEGYLKRFLKKLEVEEFTGRFSIMQSNGGRMPAHAMSKNAITALYSGPAAGVVGATGIASKIGYRDIITLDIGGTSTDVALIVNGTPELTPQTKIDGLPVRTPVIDIATVGAGGGSIAWIDDGNLLRVGPQSAGAHPGPASYGRGGTLPTITDAHLIRGTLQANSFLGGTMKVDLDAARTSFKTMSIYLSMPIEELADSIIQIAEANIVRAIQQVSTERGRDPRDFAIVAFGGAGALHAARVAEDLDINTVIVPPHAGVLSAVGLLMSDYVHFRARTERTQLVDNSLASIISNLSDLRAQTEMHMKSEGISEGLVFEHILEMRYVGQAFEVSVTLEENLERLTVSAISRAFSEAHHRIFEFSKPPEDAVEIVSYRVGARTKSMDFSIFGDGGTNKNASNFKREFIEITEGGKATQCKLMTRQSIGEEISFGPVLIEDGTSTIYVPPNWSALCDGANNIILRQGE
ncbi:MAG: hydantoinase/oxoprolinase family protein [Sneathiella sp.]